MVKEKKEIGGAAAAAARSNRYVEDGTVDLHGDCNPIVKVKYGGWTACPCIIGTILLHLEH